MASGRRLGLWTLGLMLVVSGGCTTDRELRRLTATIPVAVTCGTSEHLAKCIQDDLAAARDIPDADKAELLARAQVLSAHARKLGEAVDRFDETGRTNTSITLENLQARQEALEAEYQTAFREWGIWQVRHSRRSPDEVFEVFDHPEFKADR